MKINPSIQIKQPTYWKTLINVWRDIFPKRRKEKCPKLSAYLEFLNDNDEILYRKKMSNYIIAFYSISY